MNFVDILPKSNKISNFFTIPQGGAEFFHVEVQTDMMKLIVALRLFRENISNLLIFEHKHKSRVQTLRPHWPIFSTIISNRPKSL